MKNKALTELRRYAVMTLGCLIYAVSIAIFLDPKGLAPGGVTGIAIMVSYATKIPTGTLVLLINIPLLAIGVWKFGKQFLYCTVFSTVLSSPSPREKKSTKSASGSGLKAHTPPAKTMFLSSFRSAA